MLKLRPKASSWFCVFSLLLVSLGLSSQPSSAISLTSAQKSCITQKYGKSALSAITKAKKLSAAQSKQLSSCKNAKPGESASEPPNVGVSCSKEGEIFSFNNKPLICEKDAMGKLKWAIPSPGGSSTPTPNPSPSAQPTNTSNSPPSIGTPCSMAGETILVNEKPIVCTLNAAGKLEWAGPTPSSGQQPNQPNQGSSSGTPSWALDNTAKFFDLQFGLLASMISSQSGLGNIADGSLIELPDKSLRIFFKNGNEPSVPIKIDKQGVRSFISTDGGKTWVLEDGFRIESDEIVSVRKAEGSGYEAFGINGLDNEIIRFTSTDGKNFVQASKSKVDPSQCKNKRGVTVTSIGNDPEVVKVAGGYIGYVKSNSLINMPPWTKVACKLVSSDGTNWSIDPNGTIEWDDGGTVSNLGLTRNKAGNLELYIQAYSEVSTRSPAILNRLEVKTSLDDGKTWINPVDYGIQMGDPEIDELSTGETILLGGGFDARRGGMIMVLKKNKTNYKASRLEFADQVTWKITGATKEQVKIKNLCLNTDETSNALFDFSAGVLTVFLQDKNPPADPSLRGMTCFYALVGPEQAIR